MRNGKEDKHIHTGVVDRSNSLSVARKTKDPTEPAHPTRIPPPGLGIKRKAGNDHDETAQNKHGKHRQLCQRVMAGILRCTLFKKEIVENLSQYALPPLQRPKRGNKNHARITIPDNCPKDTINKEHREDHAGDKVMGRAHENPAERNPEKRHGTVGRAQHGAENRPQTGDIEQLDEESLPHRHRNIVHAVERHGRRHGTPCIGPATSSARHTRKVIIIGLVLHEYSKKCENF